MQDLFATHFEISGEDLDATFDDVATEILSWAWRGEGDPPQLSEDLQGSRQEGQFHLQWSLLSLADRHERALELELRHPDRSIRGIEWRSVAELCRGTDYLRFSFRIAREAIEQRLAPAAVELRRPNLIPSILDRFHCNCGGVRLSSSPYLLRVDDVERFVSGVLRSRERRLPVLVVSTASGANEAEVDVNQLADELAGLAHVVNTGGYLAWERLRDLTGAYSFVPPGGSRMYWPGFGHDRGRLHHPYWTRRKLQDPQFPLHSQVFRKLSRLSVGRMPRDPLVRELQRAIREHRLAEAREAHDDRELLEAYEEMLSDREQEVDRLHELVEKLTDENQQLVEDNQRQARQWAVVQQPLDGAEEANDPNGASVETWEEFAELAPVLESDAFVLTDRAREQCSQNDYASADRMWDHLEALAKAAEAYREARGAPGNRLNEWIAESFQIEIAMFDNNLADKTFEFDGETFSREPHVKVDDFKSPDKCGRIYFAVDPKGERFIVDHIGLHL